MKKLAIFTTLALMLAAASAFAQLGATTGTTQLSVAVVAEAGLTVTTSTTTLASTGTNFSAYTGTTNLTYYIRTSPTSGSGTISLKVTADFTPTGGPSVAGPLTATDKLQYSPTVSTPGTAATGPLTASTTASTALASFGAGKNSTFAGNSASVAWTLTNDPMYPVGTYTSTVTFTISAA
jgi:hypothetical protein